MKLIAILAVAAVVLAVIIWAVVHACRIIGAILDYEDQRREGEE